jgi:epsin
MKFFSKAANTVGDLRSSKGGSLDSKLKEATSKATWNVPNSQLHSIALATHDAVDCNVILSHCFKLLEDRKKDWRQVFKSLTLLETLLKHGSERCIEDIRTDLWKIQQWKEYRFMEQGKDVAGGIREKATNIEQFCNDKSFLQKERDKAHAL